MSTATCWRPVAYIAIGDIPLRERTTEALHALGWAVMTQPSGYHLVESLSGWILGDRPWLRVDLIVVSERLPGCRGSTIVRGLRELGLEAPIVVIAPEDSVATAELEATPRVHVLDPSYAVMAIQAIARDAVPQVIRPGGQSDRVAHG